MSNIKIPRNYRSFFPYKIEVEMLEYDEYEGYSTELKDLISDLMDEVEEEEYDYTEMVERLTKLVLSYPQSPQIHNILVAVHQEHGKLKAAHEELMQLLKVHPDYLFAKLNLANQYIHEDKEEKVPELFDNKFKLEELYPDRKVFNLLEVMAFYETILRYHVKSKDYDLAKTTLSAMRALDEDHEAAERSVSYLAESFLEDMRERGEDILDPSNLPGMHDLWAHTNQEPEFTHPEVLELYSWGFDIPEEVIRKILALPRESLVADLEKMLLDTVDRYGHFSDLFRSLDYYKAEKLIVFPIHALSLLAELRAEESLIKVLPLLSLPEEFLDFWFDFFVTEQMWVIFYALGKNQTDLLETYIKNPDADVYARSAAIMGVIYIAIAEPERREEVIAWLTGILEYLTEEDEEEEDSLATMASTVLLDSLPLNPTELIPLAEKVNQLDLLEEEEWEEWGAFLKGENRGAFFSNPENHYVDIFGQYKVMQTWSSDDETEFWDDYEGSASDHFSPGSLKKSPQPHRVISQGATFRREEPKTGPNDPCPCGSGKKYKKCCMEI